VTPQPIATVDETAARQVLLLRAVEEAGDNALWTAEDRAWATRLARDTAGRDPARFVSTRAAHAMQRLRARDASLQRALDHRPRVGPWLLLAVALGLAAGVAFDRIGTAQRINLLAPPIWLLVAWNLLVYAAIAVQSVLPWSPVPGLRRRLAALWTPPRATAGPLHTHALHWARLSAPLNGARAALLLHAAAAALALGVVAGLYLRGLVLDYRAGWQSTFLAPAQVHAALDLGLAPARALTGLPMPDVDAIAALRVTAEAPAQGPAAPWLHLYAATLALFVIGPRLLLAAAAAWRVGWRSRHWSLPASDPYFQALLRQAAGRVPRAWALPHATPVSASAALSLQALLIAAGGPELQLRLGDPVGLGQEDDAARCTPPSDTTLVLVLVDLASTPEAEAQGRLLTTLAAAAPGCQRLLLVDEAAFVARFGALPQRLHDRRQAWLQLAAAHGVTLLPTDLSQPAPAPQSVAQLRRSLGL
jgi:hypothetical protein